MTINDLTTKQITAALKFVTGQEPKRLATRGAGLKRLQREMGAHGVKPQEMMAALGLDDPEQAVPAAEDAWTAQQREHDDAANVAVMERHAEKDASAPEWVECTERAFTKAAKAAAKARGTSVRFKAVVQAEFGDGDAAEWTADPGGSSGTWASALFAGKPRRIRQDGAGRAPRSPGEDAAMVAEVLAQGTATTAEIRSRLDAARPGWRRGNDKIATNRVHYALNRLESEGRARVVDPDRRTGRSYGLVPLDG